MAPTVRVCCAATAAILMSGVAFAKTTDIGKAEVVVPDAKSTSVEQEERRYFLTPKSSSTITYTTRKRPSSA